MNNSSNKKGITLVETILYVAIFGSIISIIVGLVLYSIDLRNRATVERKLNEEASHIMMLISEKIRSAENITTPSSGTSNNLVVDVYDTNQDVEFTLSAGVISLDPGPGQPVDISSPLINVDSLEFEDLSLTTDTEIIRVSMTVSAEYKSRGTTHILTRDYATSVSTKSYDRN